MENPATHYWQLRLKALQQALEKNNFDAYLVENLPEARALVLESIVPSLNVQSISWGGSMTLIKTGLHKDFMESGDIEVIDTYDKSIPPDQMLERRRRALLADLFLTGTNAVTDKGQLVNLDMIGNRVAALTFGPRHVILLIGRNKVVKDLAEATSRIKSYTAPVNALRLDKKNPCAHTGFCQECRSPDRICNTWTITEKSFPKGRVKVLLINEDLGI